MGKATTDIFTNKSYDLGGTGNVLTGSTAEFNTALQADTFFFISNNISNMATSTKAEFDAANSEDTFAYIATAQIWTGIQTFGASADVGKLLIAGTTSGTTTLDATAVASGILTLPAATDTLVGKATADVFTNKSYDLGGTGNVLTGSATEFDTALQSNTFVFASDNISSLSNSTVAQYNSSLTSETFAYIGVANAWSTDDQNIGSTGEWQEGGIPISPIGLHDAWIPASAMWAGSTLPATGLTQREIGTSLVDIQAWEFTSTTVDETTQFTWTLPKEWDGSTTALTVEFFWTCTGGASGNVVWGVQATSYDNDNPLTAVFGTIAEVTDAFIANDDLHISGTASVTVAGTPVAGEMVQFKILRSGSDGSDTFATTAELLGVRINYTTNSAQG